MPGQSANCSAEMPFTVTDVGSKRQVRDHKFIMKRSSV
jgi:hypothetical protein